MRRQNNFAISITFKTRTVLSVFNIICNFAMKISVLKIKSIESRSLGWHLVLLYYFCIFYNFGLSKFVLFSVV